MPKPPKYAIASLHPVGRYALGVTWGDKHDSIFPFVNLRRSCPCTACDAGVEKPELPEAARTLAGSLRLQDASVMLRWGDGHETLYLVEELRDLCGCAVCKGEPNYPITGQ